MGWQAAGYLLTAYSAYTAYEAGQETKAAAGAQRQAIEAQRKSADVKAYRERVRAIREARVRRATVQAQASQGGVAQSSGAMGAVSSVSAQLGSNLSFVDRVQGYSREASIFEMKAASHQGAAAEMGAWSSVAGTFASLVGGSETFMKAFKKKP